MKQFYAHTKVDGLGNSRPVNEWEPLFTPFGDDPESECQGNDCKKCEQLAARHGHLNKVAWWTAHLAAQMFPEGPDRQLYLERARGDSHDRINRPEFQRLQHIVDL